MIDSFKGQYAWLSNMALLDEPINDGITTYVSVENYYQAHKASEKYWPDQVDLTPQESKKWGKHLPLRHDWNQIKNDVMWEALQHKFGQKKFQALLLTTDTQELVEGNWWNDTYWGVCKGVGQNTLGKMLMQIREGLQEHKGVNIHSLFQKDQKTADIADAYIGIGAIGSSTEMYAQYFDKVNSKEYVPYEIVFVSINGKRPNSVGISQYIKLLDAAVQQRVVFCSDNPSNRNRDYNTGERHLAEYYTHNGYTEYVCKHYSLWLPPTH